MKQCKWHDEAITKYNISKWDWTGSLGCDAENIYFREIRSIIMYDECDYVTQDDDHLQFPKAKLSQL